MLRLGDLVSEDNELITRHKLREFNISPLDVFKLCCVIDALPAEWRRFLRTYNYSDIEPFNLQNQTQLQLNGQNVLISKAVSKTIYKELRNRIITPPTAQLKVFRYSFFGTIPDFLNRLLDSLLLVRST